MDIERFNDILTLTVNKCILGINDDPPKNIMPSYGGKHQSSANDSFRLSQSSVVNSRDNSFDFFGGAASRDPSFEKGGAQGGKNLAQANMAKSGTTIPTTGTSQHSYTTSNSQPSQSHNDDVQSQVMLQNCPIPDWLRHNAPILLQQSLKKLGLKLENIEKIQLNSFSSEVLEERKRKAKNELKHYDSNFQAAYKRFPNREEKEPMRPLYIYYKMLKQALDRRGPSEPNPVESRIERLVDLKNERNELRTKLETYQSEFMQKNHRRIRYRQDITEVEEDYNRYKRLKDEILQLELEINRMMERAGA